MAPVMAVTTLAVTMVVAETMVVTATTEKHAAPIPCFIILLFFQVRLKNRQLFSYKPWPSSLGGEGAAHGSRVPRSEGQSSEG